MAEQLVLSSNSVIVEELWGHATRIRDSHVIDDRVEYNILFWLLRQREPLDKESLYRHILRNFISDLPRDVYDRAWERVAAENSK